MELQPGPAMRLTIVVNADDQWHHRPLYTEIVHRAHGEGLAGASVFHGIEGFGTAQMIHTSRILNLSDDLPCSIVIVDSEPRIRAFLSQVAELVTGGLVLLDSVEVVKPVSRSSDRNG